MRASRNTWAVVLAAGDGTRLASLTQNDQGLSVPKQFCSLAGEHALVDDAVQRAGYVAPRERTCIIVAAHHQRYWEKALQTLGAKNVIRQPRNCGTAIGILLAILHIIKRDPLARIVFLPADHYVRDEAALGTSLREAAALVVDDGAGLVLVGIEPEGIDPDLGYIVPGKPNKAGGRHVARFVEKPEAALVQELLALGALWNSFIFAAEGATLLGLFRQRMPQIVDDMWDALPVKAPRETAALALQALYQTLPSVDFSRAVLQGTESTLRLITAPACGWTDLGTPCRVSRVLQDLDKDPAIMRRLRQVTVPGVLNLARQCTHLAMSGRPYNGHQLLSAGQPP